MALSALIQWEVRPTNGTANAGGGFTAGASGTDYSQQNAVQVAYTDLVIEATTTNLTSSLNPFTAAHVGNVIAITGGTGFTTGLYEVVSIAAAVATMDRSVGTTASTGGTGNLGGARSGFSVGTTTLQASLVAGQKVWVKNEAWNEAVSLTINGASGAPITVEGYNTARADTPTGTNRPLLDRANAAGIAVTVTGSNHVFKYLRVTRAGTYALSDTSSFLLLGCRLYNNGSGAISHGGSGAPVLINTELDTNTGTAFTHAGTLTVWGCGVYVHDNTGNFMGGGGNESVHFVSCISEANAGHGLGLLSGGKLFLINVTVDGNTGATTDGYNGSTPVASSVMLNCIFSNNGRYGANCTDSDSVWADYNDYFGNATAARNNFPTGPNDQAVDPGFVDRANGNFAIGTALKALGYPGIFPGGLSTGYLDIGAVQRQEGAGSGGLRTRPRHNLVTDGVLT